MTLAAGGSMLFQRDRNPGRGAGSHAKEKPQPDAVERVQTRRGKPDAGDKKKTNTPATQIVTTPEPDQRTHQIDRREQAEAQAKAQPSVDRSSVSPFCIHPPSRFSRF